MNNRLRKSDRLTMDDIARGLHVSKTTVSRAISGKGRIGSETREKILEYIESMGYKPNTMARALAASKTYSIGVVIPADAERGDAPFFKDCLVGVTEASVQRDYDTVLVVVSNNDIGGLERLVNNQKVDGVVLTRFDADRKAISYLESKEVPFILIGRDDSGILQIDSNQKDGCREVTARVLGKTKKAALFAGPKDMAVEKLRYQGFSEAYKQAGVPMEEKYVFWDAEKKLEENIEHVLSSGFGCIACSDDIICIKVMEILRRKKISVPDDIQVVSFFDSKVLAENDVPVTAVHVDTRELSNQAGNLLIDAINGKKMEQRNFAECSVLYRNSSC